MNLKWIEESHRQWDQIERYLEKLPTNPPGFKAEGDVDMAMIDIQNWLHTNFDGSVEYTFEPRLKDTVQVTSRFREALPTDAPEIDGDYEYDCD